MIRRFLPTALFLLASASAQALTIGPKPAPAKPFPMKLSAKLWHRFGWDVKKEDSLEDLHFTQTEFRVEAKYLPNEHFQAVIGEWSKDGEVIVDNAYVNLSADHLNFRVGNQVIKWGYIDDFSPLNTINPEYLRFGPIRVLSERKIPVPMANLALTSDAVGVEFLYVPYFYASELDFVGSDWAVFRHADRRYGPVDIQEELPAKTGRNGTYGGKLKATLWNVDMALSYMSGWERQASLEDFAIAPPVGAGPITLDSLYQFAQATGQPIHFKHERTEVYGYEMETVLGSLGLRADAAYISSQTFTTEDLKSVRVPVIQYWAGFDYNAPFNIYINLNAGQTFIQDYTPTIAFSEKETLQFFGEARVDLFRKNFQLGYRGYWNATDRGGYHNPKFLIKYFKDISFEVGADILAGQEGTLANLFKSNNQVYGTLRMFF